jgi:hypothetical protein
MSSIVQTGNATHDAACLKSLNTLQAAIAGMPTQVAANAAYVTHYRTCLASAVANKCGAETFETALRTLGVNI